MEPIFADDEESWPSEFLNLLNEGLPRLREHEKDRARIDRMCEKDVLLRCDPPSPKHAGFRAQLIAKLDSVIAKRPLAGYHCTRLHSEERSAIASGGLRPLSKALAEKRIRRQVELGNLSQVIAGQLLSKNAVDDTTSGHRLGMIHFCFSRAVLMDESGVTRLLGSWGGEALYWAYEDDPEVGPVLRSIGKPTIVLAAVPISAIESYLSVGDRLLNCFLSRRGVQIEHTAEFQGHIHQAIGGSDIINLISIGDPRFDSLTKVSSWRQPLPSNSVDA